MKLRAVKLLEMDFGPMGTIRIPNGQIAAWELLNPPWVGISKPGSLTLLRVRNKSPQKHPTFSNLTQFPVRQWFTNRLPVWLSEVGGRKLAETAPRMVVFLTFPGNVSNSRLP